MKNYLNKQLAIALFCYCRQGERSIDFALSSAHQWQGLVEYYDSRKRQRIKWILEILKNFGAHLQLAPDRQVLLRTSLFFPFSCWFKKVVNTFKSSWSFRNEELAFFHEKLGKFLNLLNQDAPHLREDLIALRMDFFACQWAIKKRLYGIPELAKAERIEHFCQSNYLDHLKMEEMGLFGFSPREYLEIE